MSRSSGARLPLVLVPVRADDAALDRCLAALERSTPPGTRVWLADDAQVGPRAHALIEHWCAHTRLQADYTRRSVGVGETAHVAEALAACGNADVAVLASDAVPTPGWLERMAAALADDRAIATITPWCNAGETASWPRVARAARAAPIPHDLDRIAAAAASLPTSAPELPAAVGHAVLLRGVARQRAGGVDATGFRSWQAALTDLSLRLSGLGWRNALCESAFVARLHEGTMVDGDVEALAVRWPDWHARLANFLMRDPLHARRERLSQRSAELAHADRQHDLFDDDGDAGPAATVTFGVQPAFHRAASAAPDALPA
ncbi:glycosyltransferase family 2 protein [Cognatilysobacter bugurensis]|uniref:Glycosyltransferase 2-like domain-containing protein n=1 Tax=Cognatilysobacter bugurensis TaxID=543356 RepID=A0A918W9J1_9GAMM|nr:glycosyltransferase family 2 protein [Lysobacter bugurensis]GHA85321.1 hypothetical protein GCM10007067_24110 [Lysobacter bugurensis]